MKKFYCLLTFICFFCISICAQDLRKKAEENPLDCVLFLIKTENNLEKRKDGLFSLANLYWKLGKRKTALEIVEINPDSDKKVANLIDFAKELKKENKTKEFEQLYTKAFSITKDEGFGSAWKDETLIDVIKTLTEFNHAQEVLEVASTINDKEDRAFILLAVADGYLSNGQKQQALDLLPQILQLANESKWKDLQLLAKAKTGTIYLKAGNDKEAEKFYEEVLKSTPAIKEIENIFVDDLWREVFDGYKSVKNFDKAIQTLLAYKQFNSLNADGYYTKTNLVETYLLNNQQERAVNLINQFLVDDDAYSLWAAETFLKMNNENSAEKIFLATQNYYDKQQIALKLANYYEAKRKPEFAINILNIAFNEAKKIKSDMPENGMMSTSPAMRKARFLSDISKKFIDLNQFDPALRVIRSIEKPYYKARMLATLAGKQRTKDSIKLLNEALTIMRKHTDSLLDARKYQVWNEIAYGFAKIGDKNKAGEIFAEILTKDKDIYDDGLDDYLLETLAETGFYFEKSEIKADTKVIKALMRIINNWEKDNY